MPLPSVRSAPYRRVRHPEGGRRTAAHRVIAANALGRDLGRLEVVHHIDGDPSNNDPANLLVLPSQRVHMALEWFQRFQAQGVVHLFDLEQWLAIYARRSVNKQNR